MNDVAFNAALIIAMKDEQIKKLRSELDLLNELTGSQLLRLMDDSFENVERMKLKEMLCKAAEKSIKEGETK